MKRRLLYEKRVEYTHSYPNTTISPTEEVAHLQFRERVTIIILIQFVLFVCNYAIFERYDAK